MIIHITDINGEKYHMDFSDYQVDMLDKIPRIKIFDERNRVKACFILDKIIGYEIDK